MKEFKIVSDKIISILSEEKGVFVGTPHIDEHFHYYLGTTLLNIITRLKINYFFVEFNNDTLSQILERISQRNKLHVILNNKKMDQCWNDCIKLDKAVGAMVFVALCSKYFYKINTVGIDVEEEKLANTYKLITSQSPIERQEGFKKRLFYNKNMIKNIQKEIKGKECKFMVLGGCQHVGVSEKLGIKAVNVIEEWAYNKYLQQVKEHQVLSFIYPDHFFVYQINAGSGKKTLTAWEQNQKEVKQCEIQSNLFPNPEQSAQKAALRGNALYEEGNYELALLFYQKELENWLKFSDNSKYNQLKFCNYNIGSCYFILTRYDEAEPYFRETVRLDELLNMEGVGQPSIYKSHLDQCLQAKIQAEFSALPEPN